VKAPLSLLVILAATSTARADDVYAHPNDAGKITSVHKGVWEIDLGALGILSSDHQGDTTVTRFSTDLSATVSRFFHDNISVGVSALFDYDTIGGSNDAVQFGGAVDATLHLRLGLGAFFRPGLSLGGLFGTRHTPLMAGTVEEASQVGFVARLELPIAYFTSPRFLIQAGPQINFTAGSYTPTGGMGTTFTRIAGGFAVGAGYVF